MLVLLVFSFLTNVLCFTPNCVPNNQYKFYKFPVEVCADILSDFCLHVWNGNFKVISSPRVVKIQETIIIPTCAFYKVDTLEHIYGVNSQIRVLATGAFINLPNLKSIRLAYNGISEVRQYVFNNVSTETLDLSWNNMLYIDPKAFEGIRNLKELDLSKNLLLTVPINQLSKSIVTLSLSYNKLKRIALNSINFNNLTKVDLSKNRIKNIAINFLYPLDTLDLTDNNLYDLDYVDINSVKIFRIGSNQFSRVPKYVENINADKINIYPNPWFCDQLSKLWSTMTALNYNLEVTKAESNTVTICKNSTRELLSSKQGMCTRHSDCPVKGICKAGHCLSPCTKLCHETSNCTLDRGRFKCACPEGTKNHPLDITGACKRVECYINLHCKSDQICVNNKCKVLKDVTYPPGINYPGYNFDDYDGKPWWFEAIPQLKPNTL
ncbi:hypothetical protein GWI33_017980 [Rhynchophorus ferrugineus]|uniref:Uncharacterized protein n=1 Tax=Rhynchophorus ferrugineus TaxID=354439 RepID=A0A834M5R3_RHYFE|nr:hypothetical protein GWI33_017980 [Rhynchophorus ferrugineus]